MANTIEVIVKATDKASSVLSGMAKTTTAALVGSAGVMAALNDTSRGVGKVANEFLNLGSAMKQSVVGQAAQAVYSLGKTGAAALATRNAFVGLSGGAWKANATLETLQQATDGVITKQDLMQAAIKMTNMGLATSRESMGDLAKTALTLGDAMGMDATQAIDLMTQAVARGRTTSLVPLGIDVAKLTTRTKELTSGTSGLSQQQAILTAVMEQADVIAGKMGGSFDEAADSFDKFEAQIADAKTEIAMRATPAIAGFLTTISTGMEEAGQWSMRLKQLGVAMYSVVANDKATLRLAESWGVLNHEITQVDITTGDLGVAAIAAGGALDTMATATDEAATAQDDLDNSMGNVIKRIGGFKFDNESLWNLALASGASDEALMSLATTLDIATQTEVRANIEMQGLIDQFAAGEISALELEQGLIRLREEVENARVSAEGFTTALSHIPRDVQVRLNMTGAIPPEVAATMTPAEQARLRAGAAGGAAEATWQREQRIQQRGAGAPELQHGTSFWSGGYGLVGERGPELVALPRGSQVHSTHSSTTRAFTDARSWNVTIPNQAIAGLVVNQMRQQRLDKLNQMM